MMEIFLWQLCHMSMCPSMQPFALQSNPCWSQGWLEIPKRMSSLTTVEQKWWFVLQMLCHTRKNQRLFRPCIFEPWKDSPLDVLERQLKPRRVISAIYHCPFFTTDFFQNRLVAQYGPGSVLRCYKEMHVGICLATSQEIGPTKWLPYSGESKIFMPGMATNSKPRIENKGCQN